jgi:hypothetical protein
VPRRLLAAQRLSGRQRPRNAFLILNDPSLAFLRPPSAGAQRDPSPKPAARLSCPAVRLSRAGSSLSRSHPRRSPPAPLPPRAPPPGRQPRFPRSRAVPRPPAAQPSGRCRRAAPQRLAPPCIMARAPSGTTRRGAPPPRPALALALLLAAAAATRAAAQTAAAPPPGPDVGPLIVGGKAAPTGRRAGGAFSGRRWGAHTARPSPRPWTPPAPRAGPTGGPSQKQRRACSSDPPPYDLTPPPLPPIKPPKIP